MELAEISADASQYMKPAPAQREDQRKPVQAYQNLAYQYKATMQNQKEVADQAKHLRGSGELRQLASALRARLLFHQHCGISAYPFIAASIASLKKDAPEQEAAIETGQTSQAMPVAAAQVEQLLPQKKKAARSLESVHAAVRSCRRCALSTMSDGRILGLGRVGAPCMVVGDYALHPGMDTTSQHIPAGNEAVSQNRVALSFGAEEDLLFWKMMQSIQLQPRDVYVTNVLKCFLAQGQEPDEDYWRQCRQHLAYEINTVRPQLICAMGDIAASVLIGGREPVARLRGRTHILQLEGTATPHYPVVVTYHPRFLLMVEDMKRAAWEDLQRMRDLLKRRGQPRA